jgi:hypothetical protein
MVIVWRVLTPLALLPMTAKMSDLFKPSTPPFLVVPGKESSSTDWSLEINECIIESGQNPSDYVGDLKILNQLRTNAGEYKNLESIEKAYKYFVELDNLIFRFPSLKKPRNLIFQW